MQGNSDVGNVTVAADANISVTGVSGAGAIGYFLVYGIINDGQDPNWSSISDSQTPSWTAVTDSQTPNWEEVA